MPSLLRFHEVNNLLRWALARARVNIDRAGIEGYGTVRRGLQQIQSRTVYPQIFATVSSNLLLLFYSWRIKLKKKKKGRERERKGGEKSRPKRDRTRQSISRWSNKSKDRLLTTVFKSTERKKNATRVSLGFITLPCHYGFSIFPARLEEKTTPPPLDIPHRRMNELGVTNFDNASRTRRVRELKFGTRARDIQSTIEIKRGEKKWWNVSYRVTTVSQRKFERSRQEVVRFVVSSSNGNPLDILQIAYRTWERSTLFWNIFIPSKSKENPKTLSRNICLNWKIFDIERVTCSRNILRKRKRKKKERNKDYKIFLARNERLHVFKDKWSYLAIVHMLHVTILFLNEMQVKHNLLYIEFGPWSSLVNVEAPLIPEPNETSARQRLSGGSGSTS